MDDAAAPPASPSTAPARRGAWPRAGWSLAALAAALAAAVLGAQGLTATLDGPTWNLLRDALPAPTRPPPTVPAWPAVLAAALVAWAIVQAWPRRRRLRDISIWSGVIALAIPAASLVHLLGGRGFTPCAALLAGLSAGLLAQLLAAALVRPALPASASTLERVLDGFDHQPAPATFSLLRIGFAPARLGAAQQAAVLALLRARARRPDDLVARLAQGEFGVLLAGTGPDIAEGMAGDLRADLAPLLVRHGLRCAIGVAGSSPSAPARSADVLARAAPRLRPCAAARA